MKTHRRHRVVMSHVRLCPATTNIVPVALFLALLFPNGGSTLRAQPSIADLLKDPNIKGTAFRSTCTGVELWYSVGDAEGNWKMRIVYAGRNIGIIPSDLLRSSSDPGATVVDCNPTFPRCISDTGVFESDRTAPGGGRMSHDLYEMFRSSGGKWTAKRIGEGSINTAEWEGSPALSPDGKRLYFVRRPRVEADGDAGGTKVFMSTRTPSGWGTAIQLMLGSGMFESPSVGQDGCLYLTRRTDRNARALFVRFRLNSSGTVDGFTKDTLVPNIDEASDVTDFAFAPGGRRALYSVRNSDGSWRVRETVAPWGVSPTRFNVVVLRDTVINGACTLVPYRGARIRVTSMQCGESVYGAAATDDDTVHVECGQCRNVGGLQDGAVSTYRVEVEGVPGGVTAEPRSIAVARPLGPICLPTVHMIVRGADVPRRPDTIASFSNAAVRYFLPGYWGLSTLLFCRYMKCASVLCSNVSWQEGDPCEPNELYQCNGSIGRPVPRSDMDFKLNDVLSATAAQPTIDNIISRTIEQMQGLIDSAAVRNGSYKQLTIRVIGWTDETPVHEARKYTGDTIRTVGGRVPIPGSNPKRFVEWSANTDSSWFRNEMLPTGAHFRANGNGDGNGLLSCLRALYAIWLFDALWRDSIPEYRRLSDLGRVRLIAEGQGVSRLSDNGEQRSIDVEVVRVSKGSTIECSRLAAPPDVSCTECRTLRDCVEPSNGGR